MLDDNGSSLRAFLQALIDLFSPISARGPSPRWWRRIEWIVVLLIIITIVGAVGFSVVTSYSNYTLTATGTVIGDEGQTSFAAAIPVKLKADTENTFEYQSGDGSVMSMLLFSQTSPSTETVEGYLVRYLANHKVSNHSISGQFPLSYKNGVDTFEAVDISGQKSVVTRTDYQYQVASGQSTDLAVLSLTTPCGDRQLCSFWVASSDPQWSNPKQSLIKMATSLKEN